VNTEGSNIRVLGGFAYELLSLGLWFSLWIWFSNAILDGQYWGPDIKIRIRISETILLLPVGSILGIPGWVLVDPGHSISLKPVNNKPNLIGYNYYPYD
tara:strand:+ start:4058 stop:4354 length:297 start_codon:yes stop_codon:yes gene_type:complete